MGTFINGIGCISAQNTAQGFPFEIIPNDQDNFLDIVKPDYKEYFSPIASRRMAKGVKNAIVAADIALKQADIEIPDAIITGTGMGCIEDSDKFLTAILENNEQFLTPTSFIQSTHNTVASSIAIRLGRKGYNFTYVNGAVSFESALIDAKLQLDLDEVSNILIGGVDEMTPYTLSLFKLAKFVKADGQAPYSIFQSAAPGAVFSEGATFFALQNIRTANTYAEILDVDIKNRIGIEDLAGEMSQFLNRSKLHVSDIDALVLGFNGDYEFDACYREISREFGFTPQVCYKHLSGEYNTASAFGLFVASNILKNQEIPSEFSINKVSRPVYKNVLLYNQYRGADHSFTLITA